MLKIERITILIGSGADKLVLWFDLPDGSYPYTGKATATMKVAAEKGIDYCKEHFKDIAIEVVRN